MTPIWRRWRFQELDGTCSPCAATCKTCASWSGFIGHGDMRTCPVSRLMEKNPSPVLGWSRHCILVGDSYTVSIGARFCSATMWWLYYIYIFRNEWLVWQWLWVLNLVMFFAVIGSVASCLSKQLWHISMYWVVGFGIPRTCTRWAIVMYINVLRYQNWIYLCCTCVLVFEKYKSIVSWNVSV